MPQLTALPDVLGLPPSNPETDSILKSAFPVMEIIPSSSSSFSQNLYDLTPDVETYKSLLNKHGFSMNGNSLKVAFIVDNFPTDTFSNFYAESFLGSGLQVLSDEASQILQMMNARSGTEAAGKILRGISAVGKATGAPWLSNVAASVGNFGGEVAQKFKEITGNLGDFGSFLQKTATMANRALGGGRIDLPQIWKNSGFSPSYTITIRLFNPNPGSAEVTRKYIVGPICAILLLALPRTADEKGVFYTWPFFQQIRVPGLLNLPQAYIGNITVIKGGDQQIISYKQNLAMCDIRIEFGCLFDTMVTTDSGNKTTGRPSLKEYIEELESGRDVPVPVTSLGVNPDPQLFTTNRSSRSTVEPELLRLRRITSNSSRQVQEVADILAEANPRVPEQDIKDYSTIIANQSLAF